MHAKDMAWFEDSCETHDKLNHYYRATEHNSMAGTSFTLTFEEFGSFTSYSEEDAIYIFQEWYKENVETPEPDLRIEIRESPIRDCDTDLR